MRLCVAQQNQSVKQRKQLEREAMRETAKAERETAKPEREAEKAECEAQQAADREAADPRVKEAMEISKQIGKLPIVRQKKLWKY